MSQHGEGSPTGLLSLPADVLSIITDYLTVNYAKDLSLANRALYRPARYRVLRDVTINFKVADFRAQQQWLQALEYEKWLPAIRTIKVLDLEYDHSRQAYRGHDRNPEEQVEHAQRVQTVCHALRAMSGLVSLDWRGNSIPDAILECVSERPQVELIAHPHERHQRQLIAIRNANDSLMHRLAGNQNLDTLNVTLRYTKADQCIGFMRAAKAVLLTCPNLRTLRVDVNMPHGGCCIYCTPEQYHGLGFVGDEKPHALEELDLVAYPFGARSSILTVKNRVGYPADTDERDFWAKHFDWSHLQRLSVFDHGFASLVAPRSTALREITIYRDNSYHYFLFSVPTKLEAISLCFDQQVGIQSVLRHGETLRRLMMHDDESYNHQWRDQCPDLRALRQLASACADLEELEVDLRRDGAEWPSAALDVLASFSSLRKLTLWFQLPLTACSEDGVRPEKPHLTFSAASKLFQYLRNRGRRIRELILHSGAPPPTPMGMLAYEAYWPEQNAATFRCALAERDWEAAEGRFATTCEDVWEEANEWMRVRMAQDPLDNDVAKAEFEETAAVLAPNPAAKRAFRVAWLGPMTVEEWTEYGGQDW